MTIFQKLQPLLQRFATHPKQLFLIDGAGATLTAFLLGIVLARLELVFGMSREVLYPMAITACFFAVYSFSCSIWAGRNWRSLLKIIATANLLYSVVSLGTVIYFYPSLTVWGVLYFLGEIGIVAGIGIIELRVSNLNQ